MRSERVTEASFSRKPKAERGSPQATRRNTVPFGREVAAATVVGPWPKASARRAAAVAALALLAWAPGAIAAETSGTPLGANLVYNGDFEVADPKTGLPDGWRAEPDDGRAVTLVDGGPGRGKVLQLAGDPGRMAGPGVNLQQTRDIPIEANTRYRCTGLTKADGPNIIVFVKGYGLVTHNVGDRKPAYEEVYRMKKELTPKRATTDWEPFNLDFEVRPIRVFSDFQHRVEFVRIKLYAYWPPGTCWLDDIRFEKVGPVPESERLHPEAVTTTGVKPDLTPDPDEGRFDEGQAYADAGNAWKRGQYEECLLGSRRLVAAVPGKGLYRLLLARAALELGHYDEADAQAEWVLEAEDPAAPARRDRAVEDWQFDWARLVRAEVVRRGSDAARGRAMLQDLAARTRSPHVQQLVRQYLGEAAGGAAAPDKPPPAPRPAAPENFRDRAWHALGRGGVWEIVGDHEIHQKDLDRPWKNNGFSRPVEQRGRMAWEFQVRIEPGGFGAGLYVMASDEQSRDRGTSYLLWYQHTKSKTDGSVSCQAAIGKFVKDQRVKDWRPTFPVAAKPGEWVRLRFEFDPGPGRFAVFQGEKKLGEAADPEPIRAGRHVSLHTALASAAYRDLRIARLDPPP